MPFSRACHSSWSTTSKRTTLVRMAGTNSAQSALRACSLQMSKTDRLYSVSFEPSRWTPLVLDHEYLVEVVVRFGLVALQCDDEVGVDPARLPPLHVVVLAGSVAVPEEQPRLLVEVGRDPVLELVSGRPPW